MADIDLMTNHGNGELGRGRGPVASASVDPWLETAVVIIETGAVQ